ncbi:MAG TPA: hypothetical protein VIL44_09810 [Micromonospora sp.]
MEGLRRFARRLDEAAALLSATAPAAVNLTPAASAFGADAPGRIGELGRALYAEVVAAATARSREARVAAGWLAETADALRAAGDAYAETDAAARRRMPGES